MDQVVARSTNACAGIAPADREELRRVATQMLDARNIVVKIAAGLGDLTTWVGDRVADSLKSRFGFDVSSRIQRIVQNSLWDFQSGAMIGLDPKGRGNRWARLHKLLAVASGASGGFFGLPGLLWDLPTTTVAIMRSVADTARSFPGEDLASDDTRRACIEVFAAGSPLGDDDDAERGYWATRLGMNHATIRLVAARLGVVLSEKTMIQAVPVAGAVTGAALNYAFVDYYQKMARVHFTLRAIERRAPDPSAVRPCFAAVVREIRARRGLGGDKPK